MAEKVYVATIQLVVAAEDEAGATDGVIELLGGNRAQGGPQDSFLIDWAYLKVGAQRLYPTELAGYDPNAIQEGEVFERAS